MKRDELRPLIFGIVVWRVHIIRNLSGKVAWNGMPWRVTAPFMPDESVTIALLRVELFGIAALSGW